ncbi:hypothetical protein [Metabacillus litoralis]|uniref:hypothetical protein n=1 Tax=Metabacillus litoralis TaxID=152268 RepID=UPI001CFD3F45|nr:hypothetical protein [Metabacillus litoralis]
MTKKKILLAVSILGLLILFTSPLWTWQIKKTENMNVLIIDKTVPDQSYREHNGLIWLLNHLKIKKDNNQKYNVKEDYVGFVPTDQPPKFNVREFPDDLSKYDVLYVADGYGVYKDEYLDGGEEGDRSELLYGGIKQEEVNAINASLIENNQTLIAEFNTFGSPTEPRVRENFYHLLNLDWTGWMGRIFNDLSNKEVPVWVKDNYEKQYGEKYSFTGTGLIFVSEEDEVIVFTDKELKSEFVTFNFTENGQKQFNMNEQIQYNYWFDIVEARNEEEVQATFELSLSDKAKAELTKYDIPLKFPAVIHHQDRLYDTYYFAGDFVDHDKIPSIYQISGLTWWQKMFSFEQKGRTDTFFWKAYVPMMKKILAETQDNTSESELAHVEPEVLVKDGMKLIGSTNDKYLQVYKDGAWEDILIKGVNMGIAKPGTFPGETGITKEEYARWFDQISAMNANGLRVYTIHPPAFYQALYEHNLNREDPLYLFHGVWVNEETFLEKKNAFDPAVITDFKEEIQRTIDIIHGNATIEPRLGHASGKYEHDLSPYLLGWVIGVEWDPEGVVGTNESNPTISSYDGKYITTSGASPFEAWLAEMMDFTATYEAETYDWQHPMSFTNWVTTDLLEHPAEPSEKEDMVSVDPNLIKATSSFYPGLFASYHIYPYYPDFLNYEEEYVQYVDHRGEKNNYAGYLHDMKENHDIPLLVAEFGIPASRGMTHENVYGLDQGNHSEKEQGEYIVRLFEDIVEEDMAGGMIFTWQDEWFKRTWNTMDYDNPDQRPFWDNIQTNEQHFGLLSFDPDKKDTQLQIDGDHSDWMARNAEPIYKAENNPIENVYLSSDSRGLFVRIDYNEKLWNTEDYNTYLLLDTIGNQGQTSIPEVEGIEEQGIDFLVELKGENNSRVLIDSYYDTYYYHYGHILEMIDKKTYANQKNNGNYHQIHLTLNKELTINKEEGQVTIPFSDYETGELQYGIGNPEKENSNTLSDYYIKDGTLEIRLPWLLLNVKDPSQKEIMGDIWSEEGLDSKQLIDLLKLKVVLTNKKQEVLQTAPEQTGNWLNYKWENWDIPVTHERLKKSYYELQEAYEGATVKKD